MFVSNRTSGYRPPHQRGEKVEAKRFEDDFSRDKNAKVGYKNKDSRDRQKDTTETSGGTGRSLNRFDMGKGYERKSQYDKGEGFSRGGDRDRDKDWDRDRDRNFPRNRREHWNHNDANRGIERGDVRTEREREPAIDREREEEDKDRNVTNVSQQRDIKPKGDVQSDFAFKRQSARFQSSAGYVLFLFYFFLFLTFETKSKTSQLYTYFMCVNND
ncbi:hypothetical protein RFI_01216, partial [Reticulomyxa filosa]